MLFRDIQNLWIHKNAIRPSGTQYSNLQVESVLEEAHLKTRTKQLQYQPHHVHKTE